MKRIISMVMVVVMLCTVGFVMPAAAEEEVNYQNKICTIENENGYLSLSPEGKGKGLTVSENANEWRLKGFLDKSLSFVGEGDMAADVNSASTKEGVTIIQWTNSGALNQRWFFEEAEGGYYIKSAFSNLYVTETDGVITQEVKNEELNQIWKVQVVGEFEPIVEKMLASDAAKSINPYRYERLYTNLMTGGEFNVAVYNKVEKKMIEEDYFNLPFEKQVEFVEACFQIDPVGLMGGKMTTKNVREVSVEFAGIVKEGVWQSWHGGIPKEDARKYLITIKDTETGDSHTFEYYCPDDNDEEYAIKIGEAVGAFEMPVVKELRRFIYTGHNTSSWNGEVGGGTIWNNTAYRGGVDNMIQYFAHEIGHVMDDQGNDIWNRAKAQDIIPVSGYGKTNRYEDLAEFSRMYLLAKSDPVRLAPIEATHPARTRAFKALLYTKDNEFYADYKDEYEAVMNETGDYDKSVQVKLSLDGKYLTDRDGELVLADEFGDTTKNWQTWEAYTSKAGSTKFKNKATGRMLTLTDHALTLGEGSALGLKSAEGGYIMIEAATGFAIGKEMKVDMNEGAIWKVEEVGTLAFTGDFTIKLSVTGKYLAYEKETGLVFTDEPYAWSINPVDENYYIIRDKATGMAFDINGNSKAEGAKALIYKVTGGTNQHFKFVSNGYGAYKLELRHSGLYLTSTEDGFFQSSGSLGYVNWNIERIAE